MQLNSAEARRLAIDVLSSHGLPGDQAGIVADHLVDAAEAGHEFAGLPRVLALIEHLKEFPAGKPITVTQKSRNSAIIDGAENNGYVTSLLGVDKAIELARETGIGIVAIHNTWFSGRLAYYVERAAREGFIAFHTASTQARVAPTGGIDKIFGTNPIAFAFPCEPEPLVIDFGTGMTTWGDVLLRQKLGKSLDPGCAVDPDGNPTTDPAAALLGAFLPWGGPRGYGLSLAVQVLAALCGGEIVAARLPDSGFFFLVLDPALLLPLDEFRRKVTDLVALIEGSRPAPGGAKVRAPGRGSAERRHGARARGWIEVNESVYKTLVSLRNRPVESALANDR